VISELRQRGGAGGAFSDMPSSGSSSSSISSSASGSVQQLSGAAPDSTHLIYALLYSTADDRYEMVSYTMHTLTGMHLQ
jgi:hypothetical protein